MARYVFLPFTPNLHFPKPNTALCFAANRKRFMDSADRVMLAVSGSCSAIRSFTLNSPLHVDSSHTKRWTRNVLNFKVSDFILDKTAFESLVLDESACKTLVDLKLDGAFKIPMLLEDTSFPALKSLTLAGAHFCSLGSFEKLISACSLLEELTVYWIFWELWKCSHILSCPNLKRLSIISLVNFVVELGSMSFDIPNLVYLDYSDDVQRQYPVVRLDSLVEAKLELMIFDYYREAVPVFENVSQLSLITDFGFCSSFLTLPSLPYVLKKFPNVHTLVIEGPLCGHDHSKIVCDCFSVDFVKLASPVKVLELTINKGSSDEMEQVKRFLEDLSCLELVKVRSFPKDDEEKLSLATRLLMLPRASSKCKIQVKRSSLGFSQRCFNFPSLQEMA
ncbi:BnaCnng28380D [Brassica napus]|uniref:BnaCnng28380D protein n=3 Tax=Brassica TaxID=3705 RepID=A0A078IY04_BRANA|nr:BnaCnng28380D [Brassica napus]